VHRGSEVGVRFVQEIIPSRLLAFVGRLFFSEPFCAAPITGTVYDKTDSLTVEYRLPWRGKVYRLAVTGGKPAQPVETSEQQFFTQRQYGFDRTRWGQETQYQVVHPEWAVYPVLGHEIEFDWAAVYGPDWAILNGAKPHSTIFAVGSPVQVNWASKAGSS
jgi:hypothetical protein